jgi:hypothetical protein
MSNVYSRKTQVQSNKVSGGGDFEREQQSQNRSLNDEDFEDEDGGRGNEKNVIDDYLQTPSQNIENSDNNTENNFIVNQNFNVIPYLDDFNNDFLKSSSGTATNQQHLKVRTGNSYKYQDIIEPTDTYPEIRGEGRQTLNEEFDSRNQQLIYGNSINSLHENTLSNFNNDGREEEESQNVKSQEEKIAEMKEKLLSLRSDFTLEATDDEVKRLKPKTSTQTPPHVNGKNINNNVLVNSLSGLTSELDYRSSSVANTISHSELTNLPLPLSQFERGKISEKQKTKEVPLKKLIEKNENVRRATPQQINSFSTTSQVIDSKSKPVTPNTFNATFQLKNQGGQGGGFNPQAKSIRPKTSTDFNNTRNKLEGFDEIHYENSIHSKIDEMINKNVSNYINSLSNPSLPVVQNNQRGELDETPIEAELENEGGGVNNASYSAVNISSELREEIYSKNKKIYSTGVCFENPLDNYNEKFKKVYYNHKAVSHGQGEEDKLNSSLLNSSFHKKIIENKLSQDKQNQKKGGVDLQHPLDNKILRDLSLKIKNQTAVKGDYHTIHDFSRAKTTTEGAGGGQLNHNTRNPHPNFFELSKHSKNTSSFKQQNSSQSKNTHPLDRSLSKTGGVGNQNQQKSYSSYTNNNQIHTFTSATNNTVDNKSDNKNQPS